MKDYLIGRNPVMEALKSGREIDKLLVRKGRYEGSLVPIIKKAKQLGIVIQETDRNKLDQLADGENHQGVIALISAHPYASVEEILKRAEEKQEPPFLLICDKLTDPHNLGAILRTADAVGVHGVIIPKRNSVGLTAIVAKTSAGAVEYVPVAKVTNLTATIEDLKKRGMWVAAADMDGEEMTKTNLTGSLAIVIGSEGDGVSRLVKESCDFSVKIPMRGQIQSLNASVAASVLMYEAYRQRNI